VQFVNKSVKNIPGDVSAELAACERHPKMRRRENAFLIRIERRATRGGVRTIRNVITNGGEYTENHMRVIESLVADRHNR